MRDNLDLERMEEEIKLKKSGMVREEVEPAPSLNPIITENPQQQVVVQPTPQAPVKPIEPAKPIFDKSGETVKPDKVDEVINEIFGQAIAHTIRNDENVNKDVLDTAKQVITDKVETLGNRAEQESKAAYFDNHKDACAIFGYDEKTTNKSLVKIMKGWAYFLNLLYIFTAGFFIISPVTFICKKLKVVIKQAWLAILIAVLIYIAIITIPLVIGLIPKG